MKTLPRRVVLSFAISTLMGATTAQAQAPTTPLRVILPVGAGSGVDTLIRAAQTALSKALGGQPVVIENLPGAGGITGTSALVKAAPDGNTVAFISNNHSVNPSVYKNVPYDGLNDITPITVVGASSFVVVANPKKVPAKGAKEMQSLLRSQPGKFNMASSGNGTVIHLAGEMYVDALGGQVQHIPYKGMGPMVADIIGGQVDFGVAAVPAALAHIASGRLKAIGVMSKQRAASLPDVPTIAEQGFPDVDIVAWFAMVAPKGLSAAHVDRLHKAVVIAFSDPEVKAAMTKQSTDINPTTPEHAAKFLKTEQERYARLVTRANITVD